MEKLFQDHGVAVAASESRGVIAAVDNSGRPVVATIAMNRLNTSLLLIDVTTGQTQQYWYPHKDAPNSPSYCLLMASTGRVYVTFGADFLEFDPVAKRWTFHSNIGETAMSLAEAPNGVILAATYPSAKLIAFEPQTRTVTEFGQLDPTEHYVMSLVADEEGWVYAGIGTARSNLVAINLSSGVFKQLIEDEERQVGTGKVYKGIDGRLYGQGHTDKPFSVLRQGKLQPTMASAPDAAISSAIRWQEIVSLCPEKLQVLDFNMPEKVALLSVKGKKQQLAFSYESAGADITSLTAGAGSRLYGSSAHPMHFFCFDQEFGMLTDFGGIQRVGGGNFPGLVAHDNIVFGATYASGDVWLFDTNRQWNGSTGADPNPKHIAQFKKDLARPRAVLAHPDGKHFVVTGFPGYGLVGGGMGIVNIDTQSSELLRDEDLMPEASIMAMRFLPSGDLVAATSVEAVGGGHAVAQEAQILVLDWAARKVAYHLSPLDPPAREIVSLEVTPQGLVFGLARDGRSFVFDTEERKVIHTENLASFGVPVRTNQSLFQGPEGSIYALLSSALLKFHESNFAPLVQVILPAPATAGIAVIEGRLYYASGTHLCSFRLGA